MEISRVSQSEQFPAREQTNRPELSWNTTSKDNVAPLTSGDPGDVDKVTISKLARALAKLSSITDIRAKEVTEAQRRNQEGTLVSKVVVANGVKKLIEDMM